MPIKKPIIQDVREEANRNSFLLQENLYYLLLEDGSKIIIDLGFNLDVQLITSKPKIVYNEQI